MDTISFKIPKEDKKFLEWFSEKVATPIGSLYRTATLDEFKIWKFKMLTKLYSDGQISFMQMCKIGEITLSKGMLLIQEYDIEPPIPDILDDYTIELTKKNIESKDLSLYKNKKDLKRKSKEVIIK